MAFEMVIVPRIISIEKSFLSPESMPIFPMVARSADMRWPTSTSLRGSPEGDVCWAVASEIEVCLS